MNREGPESSDNTTVIKRAADVTTIWLTGVLRRSDLLSQGAVAAILPRTGHGNWSTNAILDLTYTPAASGPRPASLFLKMVATNPDSPDAFSDSEVRYYTEDYVDVPNAPLLPCYHAAYDGTHYHLLLADVSATHRTAISVTPDIKYGYALAEALATLHARWWATRQAIPMPTAAQVEDYVAVAHPGLAHVLTDSGSALERHWPDLMRKFFVKTPQDLLARLQTPAGFSLVHGDLNAFNILVPTDGDGRLYLIDRQPFAWKPTTWLAVSDLAFVLISDWSVEERRRWEVPILKRYHRALGERGVTDYSWDQLWRDYQLCLMTGIYSAVEFCKNGVDEATRDRWQSLLARSMAALDDFGADWMA